MPGCNMAFRRDALEAARRLRSRSSAPRATTSTSAGGSSRPGSTLGFSPAARRLAPPPRLRPRLLPPAARLRAGGGAARAQVAGELQRRRSPDVDGPPLRQRAPPASGGGSGGSTTAAGAPACSSVSTSRRQRRLIVAADAGVVAAATPARRDRGPGAVVDTACRGPPTPCRCPCRHGARGRRERRALLAGKRCGWRRRLLTTVLYLLQPPARLKGRLAFGLSPWGRRAPAPFIVPRPRSVEVWSEDWHRRRPG